MPADRTRPALLVDLYELTMAQAYWRSGMAERAATFSLFVRDLPPHRSYLVAAGLDDCLTWLEDLRFENEDLALLRELSDLDDEFLGWLGGLGFDGTVRAVPEGTIVVGGEPIIEVTGPAAAAQLAETFLLNQVTLQTTLASKAARVVRAAGGRAVIDFALRRTPGIDAGMKLARIARMTGMVGTSNVAGAARYGLPASGTMAHAFVQAHRDETDAFRHFAESFGSSTVLLVDTYDTPRGVDRAIEVAREMRERGDSLRGIRLDSGDLVALSIDARARLDAAGFGDVRIFVSGGLDEYRIAGLVDAGAAIDGFGVGTALGTSDDSPKLDTVYKLVEFDGRPVLKTSPGKETWPGAKQVWRRDDWDHDVLATADEPGPGDDHRPLLETVMSAGTRTGAGLDDLETIAQRFAAQSSSLPERLTSLDPADPAHRLEVTAELRRRRDEAVALVEDDAARGS